MIEFLKYKKIYLLFSLTLIAISIFSLVVWGFNYSIEFTGGTNLQYKLEKPLTDSKIKSVASTIKEISIEEISIKDKETLIRMRPINEKIEAEFKNKLELQSGGKVTVLKSETVGASLSGENIQKTFIAAGLAVIAILLYIAWSFKNITFAFAAVVALLHDVVILTGMYSLLNHFYGAELDTMFVTAALTTMSFSVHDTIIMFDQLRHYIRRMGTGEVEKYANISITETFVRSMNNSMTTAFMMLALVLLGGDTIRFFILALLIGVIVGTYSSPFVAMNMVVWLIKRKESKK